MTWQLFIGLTEFVKWKGPLSGPVRRKVNLKHSNDFYFFPIHPTFN